MKVVAILQARASSSRLPNKVLLPILDRPMLARQVERISRSKKIDKLIVATSTHLSDNPVEELCNELSVPCFRGELNDVLSRFYFASLQSKSEYIVRLTGDCPLTDPEIIDSVINYHIKGGFDYTSNSLIPTFPDGLDVEVMNKSVLRLVYENARLTSEREHVTLFINNNKESYKIGSYENKVDLSSNRWTVDEKEDLDFVKTIYSALYKECPDFSTKDILKYLEKNPEISNINSCFERNEGLAKSLKNDCVHKV